MGTRNQVGTESYRPASLCSLAGRYENPIPTRFLLLAPIHSWPQIRYFDTSYRYSYSHYSYSLVTTRFWKVTSNEQLETVRF
jgi:hypothetical protein